MKKMTKALSLLMTAALIFSAVPATPAIAAETENASAESETVSAETENITAETEAAETKSITAETEAAETAAELHASAASATDYFSWEDELGNVWSCAVIGENEAAVYGVSNAVMELEIPEFVANDNGGYKVTQVLGRREMYDSYSYDEWFAYSPRNPDYELISITFPDSVEYIGEAAFGSAFMINGKEPTPYVFLQRIELPQNPVLEIGEYAFKGCISLEEIIFKTTISDTPQPVHIGRYAFKKCSKLKSITFPDYTTIEEFAFEGCDALEEVLNIPGSFQYYLLNSDTCLLNHISFSDKEEDVYGVSCCKWSGGDSGSTVYVDITGISQIVIPQGVKSVGGFSDFVNLSSVTLPEGLEKISWGAFENCKQLSSINIPSSVTIIDNYAFYGCSALHISIHHPEDYGVQHQYTFSGITDITIPETSYNLPYDAFWGCNWLQSINITDPDSPYHTLDGAVYRKLSKWNYDTETYEVVGNCLMIYPAGRNYGQSYTIPDHADAIDGGAFYGAGFSEIHIPHKAISPVSEYYQDIDEYIYPFDYMRSHCKVYYYDDPDLEGLTSYLLHHMGNYNPGNNAAAGGEVIDHEWIAINVPVSGISVSPSSVSVKVNEEKQLKAVFTPSYASNKNVTWSVADKTIASVSSTGLVKGLKAGTTTVTATSADGNKKASCTVTVTSSVKPTGIKLNTTSTTVNVGSTVKLTATLTPANADPTLTWTSSNTSLATVNANGTVSGKKVGTVTITAKTSNGLTASCKVQVLFTDVPASGKYYSTPVYWAVGKGITNGYTDSDGLARTFQPGNNCTREAVVTFLWRLAGKPEPKSMVSKFSDVQDSSKYYYKAVLWASEKGITSGYSDGTFRPGDTCLREHVVTFLWRYAGKPKVSLTNTFTDVKTSDYYYNAVLWAAKNNITKGYSDDNYKTFRPKLDCLREHVVTFLYRYAILK